MEITTITKIGLAEITGLAEASKRQPDVNCQDTMSYALKTIERTMRDNLAETESLLIRGVEIVGAEDVKVIGYEGDNGSYIVELSFLREGEMIACLRLIADADAAITLKKQYGALDITYGKKTEDI